MGRANVLSDEELVDLLHRPPKLTEELRTKSSFQSFFSGIASSRMRALLQDAYSSSYDGDDDDQGRAGRDSKVEKRLELMRGFMA